MCNSSSQMEVHNFLSIPINNVTMSRMRGASKKHKKERCMDSWSKGSTIIGRKATRQRHMNWEQNKMMTLIKRQTWWKCNTKTTDGSNNAHGTYCSVVEQNCKWILESGPQQSSKK